MTRRTSRARYYMESFAFFWRGRARAKYYSIPVFTPGRKRPRPKRFAVNYLSIDKKLAPDRRVRLLPVCDTVRWSPYTSRYVGSICTGITPRVVRTLNCVRGREKRFQSILCHPVIVEWRSYDMQSLYCIVHDDNEITSCILYIYITEIYDSIEHVEN